MTGRPEIIATYGFNVPCRRFIMNYTVTHDRRISVVDEFVLRLLSLTERVPAKRVGAFLGMSVGELDVVVQDLRARGMLDAQGDDIGLTSHAAELFRRVEGSFGRLVHVDAWVDTIWFDLVGRNLMVPRGGRPADNLLTLESSLKARDLPEEFARSSFEENFREVVAHVRQIRDPGRFALYAITDAIPDKYGSVVVTGEIRLSLDPAPHVTQHFLDGGSIEGERHRPLRDAMRSQVAQLVHPAPSGAGVSAYRRLTGDTSIESYSDTRNEGSFGLDNWLAAMNASDRSERSAVFGATYLTRNIDRLVGAMHRRTGPLVGLEGNITIHWFRPVGSGWGATPDLSEALRRIRAAAIELVSGSDAAVQTALITPPITRTDTRKRFKRLFDKGMSVKVLWLASSLEVIYIKGLAAMVVTHVPMGSSVTLPVGMVTTEISDLDRIAQGLRLNQLDRECEYLWPRQSEPALFPNGR